MKNLKFLLLNLLLLAGLSAHCQDTPVFMKWKLKPGEVITYKTTMKETDTAGNMDIATIGMAQKMDDTTKDNFTKVLGPHKSEVKSDNITVLKKTRGNIIDIEMHSINDTSKAKKDTIGQDSDLGKFKSLLANIVDGAMLRGSIYENGIIESFYVRKELKNLISVLFELPGKAVRKGDSWALDVHYISMDQTFKCDSSYRSNTVTVTNISNKDGQQIVTLNYDIIEYVQGYYVMPLNNKHIATTTKVTYRGTADFSVDKGRWIRYNGILSNNVTGIIDTQSIKTYSLVLQ